MQRLAVKSMGRGEFRSSLPMLHFHVVFLGVSFVRLMQGQATSVTDDLAIAAIPPLEVRRQGGGAW